MKQQSQNKLLIIVLLFVGILISGSLVFAGIQLSQSGTTGNLQEQIQQGIQSYIEEMESRQQQAQKEAQEKEKEKAKNVPKVSLENDHIRGNTDTPISLIEYSDFECPYCKKFHPTVQKLIDTYPQKINWVYRHFPLAFHAPLATQQALASECVADIGGNNVFWEYADAIFDTTRSNGKGMEKEDLFRLAQEQGINVDTFSECLESKQFQQAVDQDIQEGSSAGVSGTPGNFMIHNTTREVIPINGAYPFEALEATLKELLE